MCNGIGRNFVVKYEIECVKKISDFEMAEDGTQNIAKTTEY